MASLRVDFHPEAERELLDAAAWYERHNPQVAERFEKVVRKTTEQIAAAPNQFPRWGGPTRCALVARFPYQIIFLQKGDSVQVIAIAHAKGLPGYWQHRVDE